MNEHVSPKRFVVNLSGAFIRRVDLSNANLTDANFSGVDAAYAIFRNADFHNANLDGAKLQGADFTGATNLTEDQLSRAELDATTKLPDYLDRAKLGL